MPISKCVNPGCDHPAKGLDDEHCQTCWESHCDRTFTEWGIAAEAAGLLDLLEQMSEEG